MPSSATRGPMTTESDCDDDPSPAATGFFANTTTADEEEPPPPPEEQTSRYFRRHRQGHAFSALKIKQRDGTRHASSIVASFATKAAAVASVAAVACCTQTPTSATGAALVPAHVTPSLLKISPTSSPYRTPSSPRFACFAATPPQEEQSSQPRRSKRKRANAVVAVSPEPSSFSSFSKHRKKQPKSAAAAASSPRQETKNTAENLLPQLLPSSLRTESFQALTPGRFPSLQGKHIVPHTLILGTHPSITSLQKDQYYGHAQNAFWWIAGECLGFRRGTGISELTGKPFALTAALRHGPDKIISYPQQTERLMEAGFLLWDVVASCERAKDSASRSSKNSKKTGTKRVMSSLDQDIKNEIPNDIRHFCTQQYPTIRRIVFANGQTGSSIFCKHNKGWLASGELFAGADELSQRHLAKACRSNSRSSTDGAKKQETNQASSSSLPSSSTLFEHGKGKIELIAAISVSPAAARYSFAQKRDYWAENVYEPGLRDHKDLQLENSKHETTQLASSNNRDTLDSIMRDE